MSKWCPLTLFETLYKLISEMLANRLKPSLDKILGICQEAYIPVKCITKFTRNMYDYFAYAKNDNLPGLLLLIDFEKAFNLVSFKFILTTLDLFGFGDNSKTWVKINLGIDEGTNFQGKGDPVSGYLSIMVIEILSFF